jgi:glycosyltransferase involved in cell wall biosynthesis
MFSNISSEKIQFCSHGIRDVFFSSEDSQKILPLGLTPHTYFLFVGMLEKRKNIEFLIDQFLSIKLENKISTSTRLVLAGRPGYGYQNIKYKFQGISDILTPGAILDADLIALYIPL